MGDPIYERMAVARPADDNLGATRARPPAAVAAMRHERAAGVTVPAIAEQFGVTVRTAYRYLADDTETVTVRAGCWLAEFAVDGTHQPRRLTPWRRG